MVQRRVAPGDAVGVGQFLEAAQVRLAEAAAGVLVELPERVPVCGSDGAAGERRDAYAILRRGALAPDRLALARRELGEKVVAV